MNLANIVMCSFLVAFCLDLSVSMTAETTQSATSTASVEVTTTEAETTTVPTALTSGDTLTSESQTSAANTGTRREESVPTESKAPTQPQTTPTPGESTSETTAPIHTSSIYTGIEIVAGVSLALVSVVVITAVGCTAKLERAKERPDNSVPPPKLSTVSNDYALQPTSISTNDGNPSGTQQTVPKVVISPV